jgi:glycosyltransferase involved in cell wall biosynthesis
MKIVQVVQRYCPAFGGAESQVKSISEELVRRGHEVHVVTSNSTSILDVPTLLHPMRRKRFNLLESTDIQGVKIDRYNALFRFYGFLATVPMRKLFTVEADIVHAYCFYVTTSLVAMVAARWRSLPFLLTANDAMVNPYGSPSKKVWAGVYNCTLGKALTASSERIIAVSETNANDLSSLGVDGLKIRIIPNGVNVEKFISVRTSRTIRGEPLILYVGRVSEDKGLKTLIQAVPLVLKDFPLARFLIVGEDYGYLSILKSLVQELGVEKSVVFIGRLPDEQLVRVYKMADVFVLPSELEAFGIVVIEAMASGLPVVVSNMGGMKNIVQDGKNGLLFTTRNSRQLGEKIISLLNDEELRIRLAENGTKTVLENYSINRVVDKLEKLYAEVLS